MATLNAIDPTPEQIKAFLGDSAENEPVFMLNLLKFKAKATYKDGEDVSGATAYGRYAKAFAKMLVDLNIEGTETVYSGRTHNFLIGEGQGEWDAVAIVRYPNAKTMFETVSSDAYRKFHYHRKAGLAGQLLIRCDNESVF
jgi:uncharacterized protein (DUF1330 family)